MAGTSSTVKNRWNRKNYDSVLVMLPKGMKERLKAACEKDGISMNSIFVKAAKNYGRSDLPHSLLIKGSGHYGTEIQTFILYGKIKN